MKSLRIILLFFLLFIILTPNFVVLFGCDELAGLFLKKIGYLIVSVACVIFPSIFLRKKQFFILEGILSLFVAPIELSSIYLNRSTTNFMMMDTILSTNFQEATELLSSVWFLVLFNIIIWVAYFVIVFKWIPNEPFWTPKIRKFALCLMPAFLLLGFAYFFVLARKIMTSESTLLKDNLIDTVDMIRFKFKKIFPFDVYIASSEVYRYHAEIAENQRKIQSFRFGLEPKSDDMEETVVLVIGETARWENFGLNGYVRNTTPLLSQQKNFVSYSRVASMANLTSNSLPLIVTRANASHWDVADREKSVSEAFSEAGFHTSWITNQESSVYLGRIMQSCDFYYSCEDSKDMDLLTPLDSVLRMPLRKNFIVVHSMGSHFKYDQRYPADFEIFKPCFGSGMDYMAMTPDNASLLRNAYDNTICYTDCFLHGIIQKLEDKGGVWSLFYLSDHGENIFDDDRNLIMHGSLVVTEHEIHIPFFVAYSDAFEHVYSEKVKNIVANRTKNITSEVVFHSLLNMADLRTSVVNDSLCIGLPFLPSLDSTTVLNGNRESRIFYFKSFD